MKQKAILNKIYFIYILKIFINIISVIIIIFNYFYFAFQNINYKIIKNLI